MALRAPTPNLQKLFDRIYFQLKKHPELGKIQLWNDIPDIDLQKNRQRFVQAYIMEQVADAFDAGEITQADLNVLEMGWDDDFVHTLWKDLYADEPPIPRRSQPGDDVFAPAAEGNPAGTQGMATTQQPDAGMGTKVSGVGQDKLDEVNSFLDDLIDGKIPGLDRESARAEVANKVQQFLKSDGVGNDLKAQLTQRFFGEAGMDFAEGGVTARAVMPDNIARAVDHWIRNVGDNADPIAYQRWSDEKAGIIEGEVQPGFKDYVESGGMGEGAETAPVDGGVPQFKKDLNAAGMEVETRGPVEIMKLHLTNAIDARQAVGMPIKVESRTALLNQGTQRATVLVVDNIREGASAAERALDRPDSFLDGDIYQGSGNFSDRYFLKTTDAIYQIVPNEDGVNVLQPLDLPSWYELRKNIVGKPVGNRMSTTAVRQHEAAQDIYEKHGVAGLQKVGRQMRRPDGEVVDPEIADVHIVFDKDTFTWRDATEEDYQTQPQNILHQRNRKSPKTLYEQEFNEGDSVASMIANLFPKGTEWWKVFSPRPDFSNISGIPRQNPGKMQPEFIGDQDLNAFSFEQQAKDGGASARALGKAAAQDMNAFVNALGSDEIFDLLYGAAGDDGQRAGGLATGAGRFKDLRDRAAELGGVANSKLGINDQSFQDVRITRPTKSNPTGKFQYGSDQGLAKQGSGVDGEGLGSRTDIDSDLTSQDYIVDVFEYLEALSIAQRIEEVPSLKQQLVGTTGYAQHIQKLSNSLNKLLGRPPEQLDPAVAAQGISAITNQKILRDGEEVSVFDLATARVEQIAKQVIYEKTGGGFETIGDVRNFDPIQEVPQGFTGSVTNGTAQMPLGQGIGTWVDVGNVGSAEKRFNDIIDDIVYDQEGGIEPTMRAALRDDRRALQSEMQSETRAYIEMAQQLAERGVRPPEWLADAIKLNVTSLQSKLRQAQAALDEANFAGPDAAGTRGNMNRTVEAINGILQEQLEFEKAINDMQSDRSLRPYEYVSADQLEIPLNAEAVLRSLNTSSQMRQELNTWLRNEGTYTEGDTVGVAGTNRRPAYTVEDFISFFDSRRSLVDKAREEVKAAEIALSESIELDQRTQQPDLPTGDTSNGVRGLVSGNPRGYKQQQDGSTMSFNGESPAVQAARQRLSEAQRNLSLIEQKSKDGLYIGTQPSQASVVPSQAQPMDTLGVSTKTYDSGAMVPVTGNPLDAELNAALMAAYKEAGAQPPSWLNKNSGSRQGQVSLSADDAEQIDMLQDLLADTDNPLNETERAARQAELDALLEKQRDATGGEVSSDEAAFSERQRRAAEASPLDDRTDASVADTASVTLAGDDFLYPDGSPEAKNFWFRLMNADWTQGAPKNMSPAEIRVFDLFKKRGGKDAVKAYLEEQFYKSRYTDGGQEAESVPFARAPDGTYQFMHGGIEAFESGETKVDVPYEGGISGTSGKPADYANIPYSDAMVQTFLRNGQKIQTLQREIKNLEAVVQNVKIEEAAGGRSMGAGDKAIAEKDLVVYRRQLDAALRDREQIRKAVGNQLGYPVLDSLDALLGRAEEFKPRAQGITEPKQRFEFDPYFRQEMATASPERKIILRDMKHSIDNAINGDVLVNVEDTIERFRAQHPELAEVSNNDDFAFYRKALQTVADQQAEARGVSSADVDMGATGVTSKVSKQEYLENQAARNAPDSIPEASRGFFNDRRIDSLESGLSPERAAIREQALKEIEKLEQEKQLSNDDFANGQRDLRIEELKRKANLYVQTGGGSLTESTGNTWYLTNENDAILVENAINGVFDAYDLDTTTKTPDASQDLRSAAELQDAYGTLQKKLPSYLREESYREVDVDVDAPTEKPDAPDVSGEVDNVSQSVRDEEFDPSVTENALEQQTPAATGSNASGRYIKWLGQKLQDQRNKYEAEYNAANPLKTGKKRDASDKGAGLQAAKQANQSDRLNEFNAWLQENHPDFVAVEDVYAQMQRLDMTITGGGKSGGTQAYNTGIELVKSNHGDEHYLHITVEDTAVASGKDLSEGKGVPVKKEYFVPVTPADTGATMFGPTGQNTAVTIDGSGQATSLITKDREGNVSRTTMSEAGRNQKRSKLAAQRQKAQSDNTPPAEAKRQRIAQSRERNALTPEKYRKQTEGKPQMRTKDGVLVKMLDNGTFVTNEREQVPITLQDVEYDTSFSRRFLDKLGRVGKEYGFETIVDARPDDRKGTASVGPDPLFPHRPVDWDKKDFNSDMGKRFDTMHPAAAVGAGAVAGAGVAAMGEGVMALGSQEEVAKDLTKSAEDAIRESRDARDRASEITGDPTTPSRKHLIRDLVAPKPAQNDMNIQEPEPVAAPKPEAEEEIPLWQRMKNL